jgi:hypothetical protein
VFLSDIAPADQPPITADQQAAWYDILGQFQQKASDFDAAYQDLMARAPFVATQSADIQAQYQALVDKANATHSTVQYIQQASADVMNALKGAWNAVTGVWGTVSGAVSGALNLPTDAAGNVVAPDVINPATGLSPYAGLMGNGLGFLPLIPIAAVAAAIAAITYFLSQYVQFRDKLTLLQQYTAAGATPAQAAAAVAQAFGTGSSATSTIGTLVLIVGGLALLFYLPRVLRDYKGAIRA